VRIVRDSGTTSVYSVYQRTQAAAELIWDLARYARDKKLPYVVGPAAGDPKLLMRIGPLGPSSATDFESTWQRYLE
jgi:hypothetical protein